MLKRFWLLGSLLLVLSSPLAAQPPQVSPSEISRLGPRVLEFSRTRSVRSRQQPKLDVIVYSKADLKPSEQVALEELGVDPNQARQGGAVVSATAGVLRALGQMNFVVHVNDRTLLKMDSSIARSVVDLERDSGKKNRPMMVEVTLSPGLNTEQKQQLSGFGLDPEEIVQERVRGQVEVQRLKNLANLDFVQSVSQPEPSDLLQTSAPKPIQATASLPKLDTLHRRGFMGNGVKVAVIDSDFDLNHPQLRGGIMHVERIPKAVQGNQSHGTTVAATLRSVAPQADLILLAVGSAPGNNVYRAIDRALELGAVVINLSLGKAIPDAGFLRGNTPLVQALDQKLSDRRAVLVTAAGNYNRSLGFLDNAGAQMISAGGDHVFKLSAQTGAVMPLYWPRSLRETYIFAAWDDEYRAGIRGNSDLTLELWAVNKNKQRTLLALANNNQLAGKPPREIIQLARPSSASYGKPGIIGVNETSERFELRLRSNLPPQSMNNRALRFGAGIGVELAQPSNRTSISAAPYALASGSIMVGAFISDQRSERIDPHSGRGPQQEGVMRPNVLASAVSPLKGLPLQGTSVATPYVAGLCALLKGSLPLLNTVQIKELLTQSATRSGLIGRVDPLLTMEAALAGQRP